ncbi:MAG: hypothetical protein JNK21_00220, partial [Rhodospirillaceae bacterium]|nr:hypothetical protein [Rhodospirillaceae bacterium]
VFERTTRKVVLTADGREFLPSALAVQRQVQQAMITAAEVRDRSVEVVRVAAPLSVAAVILPPLIAEHRARKPRTTVRILDTGVEWLADRVATGEADLALGPDRVVGPDVTCTALYPSPWVLWCTPQHPLAAKKSVTWTELKGTSVFAAGRDHEHSVAPRLTGVSGAELMETVHVVGNVTTALGLAAANLGVTFSPSYIGTLAKSFGLVMRPITEPKVVRHMSLYAPARRALSEAVGLFRAHIEKKLAQSVSPSK